MPTKELYTHQILEMCDTSRKLRSYIKYWPYINVARYFREKLSTLRVRDLKRLLQWYHVCSKANNCMTGQEVSIHKLFGCFIDLAGVNIQSGV